MKTVIEMAREAGFSEPTPNDGYMGIAYDYRDGKDTGGSLERFAALVAAHERNKYLDKLAEAIDLSVKAEREACAKVCLKTGIKHPQQTWQEACAAAIRARGE